MVAITIESTKPDLTNESSKSLSNWLALLSKTRRSSSSSITSRLLNQEETVFQMELKKPPAFPEAPEAPEAPEEVEVGVALAAAVVVAAVAAVVVAEPAVEAVFWEPADVAGEPVGEAVGIEVAAV